MAHSLVITKVYYSFASFFSCLCFFPYELPASVEMKVYIVLHHPPTTHLARYWRLVAIFNFVLGGSSTPLIRKRTIVMVGRGVFGSSQVADWETQQARVSFSVVGILVGSSGPGLPKLIIIHTHLLFSAGWWRVWPVPGAEKRIRG